MDQKNLFLITFTLTLTYLEVTGTSKVIVVGGGLAGVTAARDLVNANFDVTLLEAKARPGGRIWSYDLGESFVDLGCGFIFPKEEEVLNKTVALKLPLSNITMLNCAVIDDAKNTIETATFVQNILLAMVNLQKVHDTYDPIMTIAEALMTSKVDVELANRGASAWTAGQHIMEFIMGGNFKDMSIGVDIPSDELQKVIHVVKDGMQSFVESLIMGSQGEQELKTVYNSPVTKIEKTENGFNVTSNGIVYTSKHVVVAVPAAVLKAKKIQFNPDLSDRKLNALQHVGIGKINKLVLEFDSVFWATSPVHFVGYLPGTNDNTSTLIYWQNYHHITKKPVLVGFLTGQDSVDSETLTAEQVRDKGLAVLRKMFGDATVNERSVVTYYKTQWGTDQFSLGSHVFRTPDMVSRDYEELAKSENNLHFIGDYTALEVKGLGTITGAYFSGKRVQENILYIDKFVTPSSLGPSTMTTTATKFTTPTTAAITRAPGGDGSTEKGTSTGNLINYRNRIEVYLLPFTLFALIYLFY